MLLSIATGIGGKAFAMGDPPASCGNTYNGTITGLTISNGTTTIDVLKSPQILNVISGKSYAISLTMRSASMSNQNNTLAGSIWIDKDVDGYFSGVCEPVSGANTSVTEQINAFGGPVSPGLLQDASVCVNFDAPSCGKWQIQWTAPTSSTTFQLTVNGWNIAGNTALDGYYTVLYQNGATVSTGFTPATFNLNANQQYIVEPQDYGQYVFDHWGVDGSTARDRTVSLGTDQVLLAMYRNVNNPPSGSSVTVNSVDTSNNALPGYYTILYQNSNAVNSGFTPVTFPTNNGQTYTIEVQDYGQYHFDHWKDNASTNRDRTFTASSALTLTAVYSTSSSPPPSTNSQISVLTHDQNGKDISGYYATLWQNGNTINSGYSPTAFSIVNGQSYQLAVSDYGTCTFNHWENGSTDRFISVSENSPTSVIFHAYYNCA